MCPGHCTANMSEKKVKQATVLQTPPNIIAIDKESNMFLNDISVIISILNLTGLLPVFRTISNYKMAPPTRAQKLYWIVVNILIYALCIYNLYILFSGESITLFPSQFEDDDITFQIEIVLSTLTYITTVFMCSKNCKRYLNIFNDILKVDEEINKKYSDNIVNNCGFSIKCITVILVIDCYIIILSLLTQDESFSFHSVFSNLFYLLQDTLSSIFIVYASVCLRIATVRFEYLNSIIEGYTYQKQESIIRQILRVDNVWLPGNVSSQLPSMENFPEDSLFVFRLYNKLLRLYKAINKSCSLTLVVYMGFSFYSITTTTYNLFIQFTTQGDVSLIALQLCFAYLAMPITMLAILSRCSGEATNQANETSHILARVYNKSKEHQNIINKFLTKSIKQEVQFSAYGFFAIDNSTLFKIFSAVTTYLVILIQFKQLEESKTDDKIETN